MKPKKLLTLFVVGRTERLRHMTEKKTFEHIPFCIFKTGVLRFQFNIFMISFSSLPSFY